MASSCHTLATCPRSAILTVPYHCRARLASANDRLAADSVHMSQSTEAPALNYLKGDGDRGGEIGLNL